MNVPRKAEQSLSFGYLHSVKPRSRADLIGFALFVFSLQFETLSNTCEKRLRYVAVFVPPSHQESESNL